LAPRVEGVCIPLATFKPCDAGDMIEKIDYYLEHEKERELIRRACHEHVKNHDTYTHRARQILRIVGLG
jgi:spore maturation protein CgeB